MFLMTGEIKHVKVIVFLFSVYLYFLPRAIPRLFYIEGRQNGIKS